MADHRLGPDRVPHGDVAQEVEGALLGDIEAAVGVDCSAGSGVAQGVEGAAMDPAIGVAAVRHNGQLGNGMVGLPQNDPHVVDGEKGVGSVLLQFFLCHSVLSSFPIHKKLL